MQGILIRALSQKYDYTITNVQAGFQYSTSIFELVDYGQSPHDSGFLVIIASSAFVALSKVSKNHNAQFHPVTNPFVVRPEGGVEQSCVSDLNVSIGNS